MRFVYSPPQSGRRDDFGCFTVKTKIGAFRLTRHDGYWKIWYGDEILGVGYSTAREAAEDLAGGHTEWPSSGIDPSTLDIEADFDEMP